MPDIEKQIARKVEAFVAELSELLRKAALQQAAEILAQQANTPAPLGRGRGRARASAAARARGGRRTPAEIAKLTEQLLGEIEAQPGRRVEEIARAMGISTKDLVIPTRRLLGDKQISSKGTRRATRYFPRGNRTKGA